MDNGQQYQGTVIGIDIHEMLMSNMQCVVECKQHMYVLH